MGDYTTIGLSPETKAELEDVVDEYGYSSYEEFISQAIRARRSGELPRGTLDHVGMALQMALDSLEKYRTEATS